jgi:hypothetical protein
VTTPQTVQSFIRGARDLAARLTLVTLDCRPLDIVTSVGRVDLAVYSPAVLRLRGQAVVGSRDDTHADGSAVEPRSAARLSRATPSGPTVCSVGPAELS